MKKSFLSLGLLGFLIFGMVATAFAYQSNPLEKGPNYSEEREAQMLEAFENKDYDAWYALMTEDGRNPGVLRFVNEDNFDKFIELRQARIDGDTDLVEELKLELGVGQGMMRHGNGNADGQGRGFGAHGAQRGFNLQ